MADGTATCPRCGAEYLARVTSCADCGIPLRHEGEAEGPGEPGDVDQVAYTLDDWTPDQRSTLARMLREEGVAARWEAEEVVVAEVDADLVEELLEEIDAPDALDEEEDGGDEAADALSALYVTSDVLVHDPTSSAAVVELLQLAEAAGDLPLPYGLDGDQWRGILQRADELADLLGADASEDEVLASARALRDAVRPLV